MAESIRVLLRAGARPEMIVAATHGILLPQARAKLQNPAVREVLVTDTICVAESDWPELRVLPIAPVIAGAMQRLIGEDARHAAIEFS